MAWLLIEAPDEPPRRFRLGKLDAGFGRARTNAVPIADTKCSSFHCVIRQTGEDRWVLNDAGSRNGTYANGVRLDADHTLKDGDEIIIGQTRMRFSLAEPSARFQQVINPDHHDEESSVREAQPAGEPDTTDPRATQTIALPDLEKSPTAALPTVEDLDTAVRAAAAAPASAGAAGGSRSATTSDTSVQIIAGAVSSLADKTENMNLRELTDMVRSGRQSTSAGGDGTRRRMLSTAGALLLAFVLGGGMVLAAVLVYPLTPGARATSAGDTPATLRDLPLSPQLAGSLTRLDQRLDEIEQRLGASITAVTGRQAAESTLLLDRLADLGDTQARVSAETREALQRLTRLNEWVDRLAARVGNLDGGASVASEVAALRAQLVLVQHELTALSNRFMWDNHAGAVGNSVVANESETAPDNAVVSNNNSDR